MNKKLLLIRVQMLIILMLSILFVFLQKIWVILLFEMIIVAIIILNKESVRERNFIFSAIFFNIAFLGMSIKNLILQTYDSIFLICGMFIIGLFFSSFLVLINLGMEVLYEIVREKRKK